MNPELQEVEIRIEDAKAAVKRKQALEKLATNREFKAVILEHLFKEEPQRLAAVIAEPGLVQHRAEIISELDMISKLQQFFRRIEQQGALMEEELKMLDEARDELLAEAAAE